MSSYRGESLHGNPQTSYHPSNRVTGQIILAGTDKEVISKNGIFYLEHIIVASAGVTVAIKDGEGTLIIPEIGDLDCEMSPVRCDHGIKIDGTVLMAKGFIMEDVIAQ
jgi:hypothetical protein